MSLTRRVFFRIFPTEKINLDHVKVDETRNKIYVRHLQELSKSCGVTEPHFWEFETNGVFFNASQDTVYNAVIDGVLENVMNGYNGIILCFGQTGSGKTFTSSGLHITDDEFGILPRIAKDILELKCRQPTNIKISIQMSYVEFYNTHAVDLLVSRPETKQIYKCREVRRVDISNELDALKCIFVGEGRKQFVDRISKYLSNVATSVATFHIIKKYMDLTDPTKIYSRLHIIDMAGNDSYASAAVFSKSPKQIGLANVTKSQLEQFILLLTKNSAQYIGLKQRMNTLLYYLGEDISGVAVLRFVGHIKLKTEDLRITLSMLRFGNILQGLKMKKKVIRGDFNEDVETTYLRNKIQSIEAEKHLNSVIMNQDLVTGINCARLTHLSNLIHDYLNGNIQEITIMNVSDIEVILKHMKEIFRTYQSDMQRLQAENQSLLNEIQSDTLSLKRRGSRVSSQTSGSTLSRKSSKVGSRDSNSRSKKTSGSLSMASEKRIRTSGSDEVLGIDMSLISQKRKKSTKSSNILFSKQSAQSKRKSSNTSIDKRDSRSSIKSIQDVHMPIPDVVPEKQDMWKRFINSSSYKERVEEYKQNENEVKTSFDSYIREIRKLQSYKDAVEKCSKELVTAQTYRKFNSKEELDKDKSLVLTRSEKECIQHLEETQGLLLTQQEKALTAQEILKANLENRRNIIKKTEAEFDQFCYDNHKVPSVDVEFVQRDLRSYTFRDHLEYPDYLLDRGGEPYSIPQQPQDAQLIRNLQKMMAYERRKRKLLINKKKREWKNTW